MRKRGDSALFRGVASGFATLFLSPYLIMMFSRTSLYIPVVSWILAITVGCSVAYLSLRHDLPEQWKADGRCSNCGYNLTGNVSGVCPECGEPSEPDASNMSVGKRTRLKSIRMWLGLRPVGWQLYAFAAFFFLMLIIFGDSMVVGSPTPLDEFLGQSMMIIGFIGFVVASFVGCAKNRRKPKHPAGHCQTCGYNLTGNVSGVCPECGMAIRCVPAVNNTTGQSVEGDQET